MGFFDGGGCGCIQQPVVGWPCPCSLHQVSPYLVSKGFLRTTHCSLQGRRTPPPIPSGPLQRSCLSRDHHPTISPAQRLAPAVVLKIFTHLANAFYSHEMRLKDNIHHELWCCLSYLRDGSVASQTPCCFLHGQSRWTIWNTSHGTPVWITNMHKRKP